MSKKNKNIDKETTPQKMTEDKERIPRRIIFQFHDYIDLPYEDRIEIFIKEFKIGPWEKLEKEFPGITIKRLFGAFSSRKITDLVKKATEQDASYRPANFFKYFAIECPPESNPEQLLKSISSWKAVKKAYIDLISTEPLVNPADDPRSGNQGYLDPAPNGIDARYAWTVLGGDGANVNVIDFERGWTLDHEDLAAQGATLLHGTIRDGSRAHGTAVLGEICAVDNTRGGIGIAPNIASINVVSYWNSDRLSALLSAIANLSFGDVLLIEAQLAEPVNGWNLMPIEALDAEYAAIRLATALGIVVVEAAGNGGKDLDLYIDESGKAIFNRTSADYRDSGALMVGAASSNSPHTRMGFSNFGTRIDCYAWGENVDTCFSDSLGSTTIYTVTFNGTSSASPIITGAATLVQSIAQSILGYRFKPFKLRAILSDKATGTLSNNPSSDRIGVMPDLRAIIRKHIKKEIPFRYAVKFICGKSIGDVVAPGEYWTAINVHNPSSERTKFRKKIAIALPNEEAGPVTDYFFAKLGPDEALEIDNKDIFKHAEKKGRFLKGFVLIESDVNLDVVAVYTVAGRDRRVEAIFIEHVSPRLSVTKQVDLLPTTKKDELPDLVPVPNEKGLFCKTLDANLVVTVKNQGTAPAGASMTKVDFGKYGSVTKPTPSLDSGKSVDLLFQFPFGCFDSDCEFEITVDAGKNVIESNDANNTAIGKCVG